MGYNTRFSGEILIDPPLTWAEIRRGPGLQDLRLRLVEDVQDTEDGRVTKVTAVAVAPLTTDAYSGYAIEAELQALVDAHGASHQFLGYISADGADAGDMWRHSVVDAKAVRITPRIVWPDGGEA